MGEIGSLAFRLPLASPALAPSHTHGSRPAQDLDALALSLSCLDGVHPDYLADLRALESPRSDAAEASEDLTESSDH